MAPTIVTPANDVCDAFMAAMKAIEDLQSDQKVRVVTAMAILLDLELVD